MIALLLAVAAAAPAVPPAVSATEGLYRQRDAWNAGDLEGALAAYCPEPEITWVNRMGLTKGFESFAEWMRRDFADRQGMGRMTVELLDVRSVAGDAALVSLRWDISRDGRRLMGGVSTQLWAPCRGRMRIVFEHAS